MSDRFSQAITSAPALIEAFGRLEGRRNALANKLANAEASLAKAQGGARERQQWKVDFMKEVLWDYDFAISNFEQGLDVGRAKELYLDACQEVSKASQSSPKPSK